MADKKVRVVPLVNRLLRVSIITEARVHAAVDLSRDEWKKLVIESMDAIDAHDTEQERVAIEKAETAERDAVARGEPKPKKHPVVGAKAKKHASSPTNGLRSGPPADYMERYNATVRGKSNAPFPPPAPGPETAEEEFELGAADVIVPQAPENTSALSAPPTQATSTVGGLSESTTPAKGEVPPPGAGAKSESASGKPAGDVVPPGEKPKHAHAPKATTKGTK